MKDRFCSTVALSKKAERMEQALKFYWLGKEGHIKWPDLPLGFAHLIPSQDQQNLLLDAKSLPPVKFLMSLVNDLCWLLNWMA